MDTCTTSSDRFFKWIISAYASALDVVLDHPASVLFVIAAHARRERLPLRQNSQGIFPAAGYRAAATAPSWANSTSPTRRWSRRRNGLRRQVRSDPDVETVMMVAGTSGGGFGGNAAAINVQLKPVGVRKSTSDQVIARLRRQTAGMPGAIMFLQNSQDVRVGGRQGNAQYQYTLQGPDFDVAGGMGPKSPGAALGASGDCRRQLRPAEFRLVVELWSSTAIPRRASVSRRRPWIPRSMTLLASARSR